MAAGFVAPHPTEVTAALRPRNADVNMYVDPNSATGQLSEMGGHIAPWLALASYPYTANWVSTVPDRIAVRTADGLSDISTPVCSAIKFTEEVGLDEANWINVDTCAGIELPVLSGNFGTLAPPRIVSFVVDDPDDLDDVYSAGDTLTLGLDMRTNALTAPGTGSAPATTAGDRAYVDSLFSFSLSLGADYSGGWRDASTFVVTATDVSGAGTPAFSGVCVPDFSNATDADPCAHALQPCVRGPATLHAGGCTPSNPTCRGLQP